MADLSLNKDIYRKYFGHSGNQNDPSGGGLNKTNPFFEREIGRDTGDFKVSVAKKLAQLKSNEISTLASINPADYATMGVGDNNINLVQSQEGRIDSQEDRLKPFVPVDVIDYGILNPEASHYAEMGSGGPGTAADDQRVHEAAYIAGKIKAEFQKGFNFGGENTLNDTYQPGDEGLARQLESKTYGVDGDKNLITPGNETSFIDETSDRYGQSEQNVASAAAAVAAEQAATQAAIEAKEKAAYQNQIDTNIGTPDGFFAGSNDKSGYQTNSVYAAGETDEVKKAKAFEKAKAEGKANAEELMAEMANDTLKAEILKSQKIEDGIKQKALHDRLQNDRIDTIANLSDSAAKDAAEKAAKEAKSNRYADMFARSQDSEGTSEAYLESVATEKANAEAKSKGLKEQTLQSLKEAKKTERILKDNAGTTPLGKSADDEKERLQSKERLESNASTTPLGQNFGLKEEADRKLAKEKEEKRLYNEQITNADANADFSKTDTSPVANRNIGSKGRGEFRKLQAEKKAAKAKADAAVNASENAFQEDNGAVNTRDVMARGGHDDPYHFSTLAYPPDAVNSQENGHFMLFYVNVQDKTKYSYNGYKNGQVVPIGDMVETPVFPQGANVSNLPPSQRTGKLVTQYHSGAKAAGIVSDIEYQKQMIRNGGKGNIIYNNQTMLMKSRKAPKSGINSKYPTTTRITDSVALYLPTGIGNTITAQYGDFATGVAGYLAMSGMDIGKAVAEDDFVGAASQLFDKGGTLITDAIKKLALAGLETLGGGEGLQQSFDKIFGQTLNPYIEVAFQSSGMRTFDYTFKFAPQSKAETDEVKAIIQLFRFHMLPEMKGTSHRYLTLPSTFDIHYMWQSGNDIAKENSFYNKIATCVLTSVDVNYTPNDEVQSFGDGAPTQISMALSFKETEMMTKQHINEGF